MAPFSSSVWSATSFSKSGPFSYFGVSLTDNSDPFSFTVSTLIFLFKQCKQWVSSDSLDITTLSDTELVSSIDFSYTSVDRQVSSLHLSDPLGCSDFSTGSQVG